MRPATAPLTNGKKKKNPATNRAFLILLVGVVVGLGSTHFGHHSSSAIATGADADVVRSTVKAALTTDQAMHVPPSIYPTDDELSQQRQASTIAIGRFFTGTAQKQELAELDQVITSERGNGQSILGAGISDLTFTAIKIARDSASVKASVATWNESSYVTPLQQTVTNEQHGQITLDATLQKQADGTWKVSALTQTLVAAAANSDAPSPTPQTGN